MPRATWSAPPWRETVPPGRARWQAAGGTSCKCLHIYIWNLCLCYVGGNPALPLPSGQDDHWSGHARKLSGCIRVNKVEPIWLLQQWYFGCSQMIKHDLKVLRALVNTQKQPLTNSTLAWHSGSFQLQLFPTCWMNMGKEGFYILFLQDEIIAALLVSRCLDGKCRQGWPICSLRRGLLSTRLYLHHAVRIAPIHTSGVDHCLHFPGATSDFSDSGISVNSRWVIMSQTHISYENSRSCRKLAKPDPDCRTSLTCKYVLWIGFFFRHLSGQCHKHLMECFLD